MKSILLGYKTQSKAETPKVLAVGKASKCEESYKKELENYVRFEWVQADLPYKNKAGKLVKKAPAKKPLVRKPSK